MKNIDWEQYEKRVTNYENEGMTHSDAQAIVDMEIMQEITPACKKTTKQRKHNAPNPNTLLQR